MDPCEAGMFRASHGPCLAFDVPLSRVERLPNVFCFLVAYKRGNTSHCHSIDYERVRLFNLMII